jgi:hypothetical protein
MFKKLLSILVVMLLPVLIFADGVIPYYVVATTYPVTEVVTPATIGAQIAGTARIEKILISNSLPEVLQTVTFYEHAGSTITVATAFAVDVATLTYSPGIVQIPFPIHADYLKLEDLCVRKSSTGSTVRVTIFYR